ncbi:hypothetical protein ROZALSC1DRAFT_28565 [Rozella allomycis CSF55]|uniref:Uncharacterized protein n=1 Tax=Rozella allomycis (strain CSF55) TaxID=988480 RepID=A0A075B009_ROZAC|nr:hypothetical protein O9G_005386 [Rozella allomycis CSF55]RKP19890.1 hypothetical protein ROZALSC1DRAFT_28565 [Rozella allomycis CSF55]|eukprot:EPZ35927.1 hypothetical protein O9G_005386 [Rozella allomycis CSF55]
MIIEPDDIPPLEDMSHVFDKPKNQKNELLEPNATKSKIIEDKVKLKKNELSGFKKGFLNKPLTSKKTNSSHKDSPIRSNDDKFVFREVQDAMKETNKTLESRKSEWMNNDLFEKLQQDHELSKAMEDPGFYSMLNMIIQQPQIAPKIMQDYPHLQPVLQKLLKILGEHFTGIGEKQEKEQLEKNIKELPVHEQELVNRVLERPDIQEILRDKEMLRFLEKLRVDPNGTQADIQKASSSFRNKLRKLSEVGLLQIDI